MLKSSWIVIVIRHWGQQSTGQQSTGQQSTGQHFGLFRHIILTASQSCSICSYFLFLRLSGGAANTNVIVFSLDRR